MRLEWSASEWRTRCGKRRFTEEPVAYTLRQAASGTPVAEICRKLGMSELTFYRWKKQFAGMGVAELRRL
jgi:putative transposase